MDQYRSLSSIKNIQITTGESIKYTLKNLQIPSTPARDVSKKFDTNLNLDFINIPKRAKLDSNWKPAELYKYVYTILAVLTEGMLERKEQDNFIKNIVNKETMKTWISCFTHKTYDPNEGKNYETLESVGDKILSYTFKTYLYDRFPDISASQLNNLDQQYMSTHYQSIISEKLRLTEWLRVGGDVPRSSEKIREDLLESFFGTLDTVMIKNKKFGLGFGARLCMNFIRKVFNININMDIEPARTFVDQAFQQLKLQGAIRAQTGQTADENYSTVVEFTEYGSEQLNILGLRLKPMKFVSVKATKSPAEQEAYGKMMMYLTTNGVTRKWINSVKRKEVEKSLEDVYKRVLSKAGPKFKSVEFEESYNSRPASSVFQVIGIRKEDNLKQILYTMNSFEKKQDGIKLLINNYLNNTV
jgi:dsRNA-specific ribonuclease